MSGPEKKLKESDSGPSQKQDEDEEVKSITNICYDCLERIFDFLDLESLLNVAGTCKRLQIAAAAKYNDEYGPLPVHLHPFIRSGVTFGQPEPGVRTNNSAIGVSDVKFCFSFIRCFGAKILDLTLYYNGKMNAKSNLLSQYINQYCALTISRITFSGTFALGPRSRPTFPFVDNFLKPFKSVNVLELMTGKLESQLPCLVYLFKNIDRLELSNVVIDGTAIEVTFPHLTDLRFTFDDNHPDYMITENVKKFLHANQQLQRFELTTGAEIITLNGLLHMIGENTSISKLKLNLKHNFTDVNAVELNRFVQEHPSVEELFFEDYRFSADNALVFIRQLSSLKFFQFRVKKQPERQIKRRLLDQLDNKWQHSILKRFDWITITIKIRQNMEYVGGDS